MFCCSLSCTQDSCQNNGKRNALASVVAKYYLNAKLAIVNGLSLAIRRFFAVNSRNCTALKARVWDYSFL